MAGGTISDSMRLLQQQYVQHEPREQRKRRQPGEDYGDLCISHYDAFFVPASSLTMKSTSQMTIIQ